MPVAKPDKMPDDEPMVATVRLLLLHAPPPVASVSVVELPVQITELPVMAAGCMFTVTVAAAAQPVGSV